MTLERDIKKKYYYFINSKLHFSFSCFLNDYGTYSIMYVLLNFHLYDCKNLNKFLCKICVTVIVIGSDHISLCVTQNVVILHFVLYVFSLQCFRKY